nr:transposase [Burkholderia ambifaria]
MIKVSLFAEQERETKLDKIGDALSKLGEHVDFAALAEEIDEAVPRPGGERGGRPPFPTELMVRVLVVQQLYNLSDEQMEFQLLDRLSFQRFVGLRQSSQAPDRTHDLDVQGEADQGRRQREDLRGGEPAARLPRLYRAGRADDRRQHRAGTQADADQGREGHGSAGRDAGRVVALEASTEGRAGALDQEAWQELLRLQALQQRGRAPQADPPCARQPGQRAREVVSLVRTVG